MDQQEQVWDSKKESKSSKLQRRDSPSSKKSSGFSKLAAKVTRRKSFKGKDKEKKEVSDEQVFSSTEERTSQSDLPISPTDSSGPSSPPLMSTPTLVPLSKSASKSEDSLDSGIYSSRHKSCDSVDSLDSTGSSGNGADVHSRSVMSYTTTEGGVSPTDERAHSPMNTGQYEDYWREYRDIRQSIIVHPDEDFEDKRSVTRTDSGDDDDEGDWLRQAGLADLVSSAALAQGTPSGQNQASGGDARLSTDSLTSMTILSTLTRPQREAVLRRITSFNRAQKSKRRPKPHINAVFPQTASEDRKSPPVEGAASKPPPAPTVEVTLEPRTMSEGGRGKSTSLPHSVTGFSTEPYHRRYSEIHQRPNVKSLTETDGSFLSTSIMSAFSTSALETGHVVKLDQKGYQRKEPLNSIVATESSAHYTCNHSAMLPPASVCQSASPSYSQTYPTMYSRSLTRDRIRPHFTFPPRRLSPKHESPVLPNHPAVTCASCKSSSLPGKTTSPFTKFTRPLQNLVSRRFRSSVTSKNHDVEPFEFLPITLTTAKTVVRETRVIRNTPVSPNMRGMHYQSQDNDSTSSVYSQSSTPISSVAPSPTPELSHDMLLEQQPKSENILYEGDLDKFPPVSPKLLVEDSIEISDDAQNSGVHSTPQSPLNPSPSYIAFKSALNLSSEDLPSSVGGTLGRKRQTSLKNRRSKSTNISPRHGSLKSWQGTLQKATSRSISNITNSSLRMGSIKRRHPLNFRKLKRTSSLTDTPSPTYGDASDIIASSNSDNFSASTGIETLSIQSRSTEDTNWQPHGDNFSEDNNNKSKPVSYSETADQENLPNFSLVKDRLGITRISDLSSPDVRKVQNLALIELTALFDLHSIDLKHRKFGKNKTRETGLFGIPLTTLLEWDQKRQNDTNLRVPLVLQEIITFVEQNGLSDEGILRVPGSAVRIKNLKQELETRFSQNSPVVLLDPNAGWKEARTNDVAALLKQFLRELPNPLLTYEYIDAFQSCDLIPDRKQQLQALNLLIILLNQVHRDSLKLLLKFLSRVVSKEEVNKMSLNNVAMIMAPNLFMAKKQSKRGDLPSVLTANQDVKHAAGTSNIVRMLIKYHKLLWTVPTFMLTQVRNMNQAELSSKKHHSQSKEKSKIKFLHGMTKSKDPQTKMAKSPLAPEQFDYEVPKGVIRVKVENQSNTSKAVQLDAKTTAGDVIAKFQKQLERAKQSAPDSDITVITNETHALYEVGGNINERCLDPGTNMHALTKINPEATWIIKPRTNS